MVKREARMSVDEDSPRSKRRKETPPNGTADEDVEMADVDAGASSGHEDGEDGEEGPTMSAEEVAEEGLKVWHTVKDAVDKEERLLSPIFMRLPSRRQYPDYYEIIKRPIALEDIKSQLDTQSYSSLESVLQDFVQCFKNAKKYNVKDSPIWRDAKTLQKLVNVEFDKLSRRGDIENADADGSDEEVDKKKKKKGVNIYRMMKNRLQKAVDQTDESGRLLSPIFMDLPSRKKWPVYYQIIERPICINDVFKRIKHKEYATIPDFINDVDLIFANAMQFNEEGSSIWADAVALKKHFHQIMSDLPSKYKMHGESDPSASPEVIPNKIKLKVPTHQPVAPPPTDNDTKVPLQNNDTNTGTGATVLLRVPALGGGSSVANTKETNGAKSTTTPGKTPGKSSKAAKAKSPVVASATIPTGTGTSAAKVPAQAKAATTATSPQLPLHTTAQTFSANPSSTRYAYGSNVYVPQATYYTPPVTTPSSTSPAVSLPSATTMNAHTVATPAQAAGTSTSYSVLAIKRIPVSAAGLRSVHIVAQPSGRKLVLDRDDGVRNWAMRLGGNENSVSVRDVLFADGTEDEGDDIFEAMEEEEEEEEEEKEKAREKEKQKQEEEEEEEEEEAEETVVPKRKRGRGRPHKLKRSAVDKSKAGKHGPVSTSSSATGSHKTSKSPKQTKHASPAIPSIDDVLVKLDGLQIKPRSEVQAAAGWDAAIADGSHTLEVGKKGNTTLWKVYIERRA